MTEQAPSQLVVTQFLSPFKIVLIALVNLYCKGEIPSRSGIRLMSKVMRFIETPGPEHIEMPMLDFLNLISEELNSDNNNNSKENASAIQFKLLKTLWNLWCVDSLHSFIDSSNDLLLLQRDSNYSQQQRIKRKKNKSIKKRLSRSSILGKLIFTCILSFEFLAFEKLVQLWDAFVHYRVTTRQKWIELGGDSNLTSLENNKRKDIVIKDQSLMNLLTHPNIKQILSTNSTSSSLVLTPRYDLDLLINHQIDQFEKYGTPTPPEVRKIMEKIVISDPNPLPALHYIQYLEFSRIGDYEQCFESLHRYFDYVIGLSNNTFYHFALFSLATLQARFGCFPEALRAAEEAISVAREAKDTNFLNHIMVWLYDLIKNHKEYRNKLAVSDDQILSFLKVKSIESSGFLHAIAYQNEAVKFMEQGSPLWQILESITKASFISISNDDISSFGKQVQVQSALWARIGVPILSDIYLDIFIDQVDSRTHDLEAVNLQIRQAFLLYQRGKVEESLLKMDGLKEIALEHNQVFKIWELRRQLLHIHQAINRNRFFAARGMLDRLTEGNDIKNEFDLDVLFEIKYLQALLTSKEGNVFEALRDISTILSDIEKQDHDIFYNLKFSLLYAQLISETDFPGKAFSLTLKCISKSYKSMILPLTMQGITILSNILIKFKKPNDALSILNPVFPQVFLINDAMIIANMATTLSEILILLLEISKKENNNDYQTQDKQEEKILRYLEIAIDHFKSMNDFKGMIYAFKLQIRLSKVINDLKAEEYAIQAIKQLHQRIKEEKVFGLINDETVSI